MVTSETEQPVSPWMKPVLRLAGIYNLTWGLWVMLFPIASLKVCGYPAPPTYPELWQCIGMIVGVYGIGYWIAASDPFRHWPIVFVGLLGKIFGPIGFLIAYSQGNLPLSAGLVNIFNDLIWWGPFAVILWNALRFAQTRNATSETGLPFSEAIQNFRSQDGTSLAELSNRQPVLVLFLRHSGCTFCREALSEIQMQRHKIESEGVQIAFVHMEDEEHGKQLFERYDVADLPRISDPEQVLYRAFEIGLGRFSQLMNFNVFWKGFLSAIVKGHGFSKVRSNVFRMPGTFLIHNEKILARHIAKDPSDHPDYGNLASDIKN